MVILGYLLCLQMCANMAHIYDHNTRYFDAYAAFRVRHIGVGVSLDFTKSCEGAYTHPPLPPTLLPPPNREVGRSITHTPQSARVRERRGVLLYSARLRVGVEGLLGV